MKIGWLADDPGYKGGAELASDELIAHAPAWAEIVRWPEWRVGQDVDAYVVQNCARYNRTAIPALSQKPVIKQIHDVWPVADPIFKEWLLANAALTFFYSPLHMTAFPEFKRPYAMVPNPIDPAPYRAARETVARGPGAVWLGRMEQGKGIDQAIAWAEDQETRLDFYGFGTWVDRVRPPGEYLGPVDYTDVPARLAGYKTFVMLPDGLEPFCRTVIEAWMAGCELVVNRNCGALWWLENNPGALSDGAGLFWRIVKETLNDGA
jgi:glycosyltransferase involved in cell wall biosynthesis